MERSEFFNHLRSRTGNIRHTPKPPPRWTPPAELFYDDDSRLKVFVDESAALGVHVSIVSDLKAAKAAVEEVIKERGFNKVITAPNAGGTVEEVDTLDYASADFGLCRADYAIAETGSVVLETGPGNPRSVSLLPSVAGFLVPRSAVVSRISEVMEIMESRGETLTSCLNFISGPSKTADIELNLCIGVHGPGEVYVWVIENE